MINVKEVAEWQKTLNSMEKQNSKNPKAFKESEIQAVQENVARAVELMTSGQYSEFLGHLQNLGVSAKDAMKPKEAIEIVAKFDKIRGY